MKVIWEGSIEFHIFFIIIIIVTIVIIEVYQPSKKGPLRVFFLFFFLHFANRGGVFIYSCLVCSIWPFVYPYWPSISGLVVM